MKEIIGPLVRPLKNLSGKITQYRSWRINVNNYSGKFNTAPLQTKSMIGGWFLTAPNNVSGHGPTVEHAVLDAIGRIRQEMRELEIVLGHLEDMRDSPDIKGIKA